MAQSKTTSFEPPLGSSTRRRLVAAASLAALAPMAALAQAEKYPSRPIKVIYPYPVGGSGDALARLMTQRLGEYVHGSVVLEPKPGGNTLPGATAVARAAADGYTLLYSSSGTFVLNPSLYQRLPYSMDKDFDVIALMSESPIVTLVRADSPHKDLKSLVAYAKENPGKLNYGTVGQASLSRLMSEQLKKTSGITMTGVPYPGSAGGLTDLIGGQIDVMFDAPSASLGMIQAGKLRPLAYSGRARFPLVPEAPTMSETHPDLVATSFWALVAPKGLPAEIRSTLKAATSQMLADPENRKAMEKLGVVPLGAGQTDAFIANYLRSESERWGALIREANIKLDGE